MMANLAASLIAAEAIVTLAAAVKCTDVAGDDEILLHSDIEIGTLEVTSEQIAAGEEFAADGGEEEFFAEFGVG